MDVNALVGPDLERLETMIAEQLSTDIGSIPAVGKHLLIAGGKRLRPLLAVLAARATGAPIDIGLVVGCAAELIHTATLYHDDVVDDGRVRRGRPAARLVFGNGLVVLVGDYCFAKALGAVANTDCPAVFKSLAAMVTELTEGEVAQLERAGNADATVAGYFDVIDRKTASLISWAARLGGAIPPDYDEILASYGRAVGRAFQIADDILDCMVDGSAAGKTVGRDLREGKMTLPVLLACEAEPSIRTRIRRELSELGMSERVAHQILRLVHRAGGLEAAKERALELVEDAIDQLDALGQSPFRDALRDIAYLSVERVA
ncbi:MAG TPA: polyprenyl synthetase family protein [Polyangia bacterium]|nr:polyprenyl synthetase family protein [Polyangia bacterium]